MTKPSKTIELDFPTSALIAAQKISPDISLECFQNHAFALVRKFQSSSSNKKTAIKEVYMIVAPPQSGDYLPFSFNGTSMTADVEERINKRLEDVVGLRSDPNVNTIMPPSVETLEIVARVWAEETFSL